MIGSEQRNELFAALAQAQGEMKAPAKTHTSHHGPYADLSDVIEAVREPLAKYKLCITQVIDDNVLITILGHASGQWLGSELALNPNGKTQDVGSQLTYFRRYSVLAILGIAPDKDDDGEAAKNLTMGEKKPAAPGKSPVKPVQQPAVITTPGPRIAQEPEPDLGGQQGIPWDQEPSPGPARAPTSADIDKALTMLPPPEGFPSYRQYLVYECEQGGINMDALASWIRSTPGLSGDVNAFDLRQRRTVQDFILRAARPAARGP